jgi:hypothetical protein
MWQALKDRWNATETKVGVILKKYIGLAIMILTALASLQDEISTMPDLVPHWVKALVFGSGLLVSLIGKLTMKK